MCIVLKAILDKNRLTKQKGRIPFLIKKGLRIMGLFAMMYKQLSRIEVES